MTWQTKNLTREQMAERHPDILLECFRHARLNLTNFGKRQ